MINAGFFYCNTSDRVICSCCNLICQGWNASVDDPFEVHRTISPNCPYIRKKLDHPSNTAIPIINDSAVPQTSSNYSSTENGLGLSQFNPIVYTAANNSFYYELLKRLESFATWPTTNLTAGDDLARAGFFYTGKGTTVCCFYCNGVLRNWRPNDDPIAEHVRWFPHCPYAKQSCSDEMYQRIREAQRARQGNDGTNETRRQTSSDYSQLSIPDEGTLTRLVEERLDLPISQCLLHINFELTVIKQCWEDQLRLKKSDFHSDDDLIIACLILQKQIEIARNKDNIVILNVGRQQNQEQTQNTNNGMNTSRSTATEFNTCLICVTERRRAACIPCGHLVACVPCGHSLKACPICRREIEAFARINL